MPNATRRRTKRRSGATGSRAGIANALAAKALLDRGHDAVVQVKEPLLDLPPAAEPANRELLAWLEELEPAGDRLQHRPIAGLREERLSLRCVEEMDERL